MNIKLAPVILTLLALCFTLAAQPPDSGNSLRSYGQWAAEWFKWALPGPVATNPMLGPGPDISPRPYCAYSGKGSVWFLGGSVSSGTVTRTCALPPGSSIFIPVVWAFWVRDFPGQVTFKDAREWVESIEALVSEMSVHIDGAPVPGLSSLWLSPPAFSFETTSDNIFGAPAGRWQPAASHGVWLMKGPLSPGQHTVTIHLVLDGVVSDIDYTLTVSE